MLDKPAPDRTAVPWQPEANGWAWTLIFPPRFGYVKFQSAANKGLWVLYVLCYTFVMEDLNLLSAIVCLH